MITPTETGNVILLLDYIVYVIIQPDNIKRYHPDDPAT
jgi:hypothetical protein